MPVPVHSSLASYACMFGVHFSGYDMIGGIGWIRIYLFSKIGLTYILYICLDLDIISRSYIYMYMYVAT
jgi:hypothetical protein